MLKIAKEIGDWAGEGIAYGNLGNAYQSLGFYRKAIVFYAKDWKIAVEICDRDTEEIIILTFCLLFFTTFFFFSFCVCISFNDAFESKLEIQTACSESRVLKYLARSSYSKSMTIYDLFQPTAVRCFSDLCSLSDLPLYRSVKLKESLSIHDADGNKNPTNLHI